MSTPKLLLVAFLPVLVFAVLIFWWRLVLEKEIRDDAWGRIGAFLSANR